jgi:hypothetical protein
MHPRRLLPRRWVGEPGHPCPTPPHRPGPRSTQLEPTIVRVIETPALAHALIKYRYTSKGASGQTQTIAAWRALTFAMEGGHWHLVFDQNTLIH